MAAIHPRFQDAMMERLTPRLDNAQGSVALYCKESISHSELGLATPSLTHLVELDARKWDSLVCVGRLWQHDDLSEVSAALSDKGRLFFVEPVAGFGLAKRVQTAGQSLLRQRYGFDFETDLPQALRDIGLTPTSVDRFRVHGPVFTFVAGEARAF